MFNDTGNTIPLITYDWFPKKVKELGLSNNLPTFPEDYAYYLLNDNETLIMISGIKSIRSNFKFNLNKNEIFEDFLTIGHNCPQRRGNWGQNYQCPRDLPDEHVAPPPAGQVGERRKLPL